MPDLDDFLAPSGKAFDYKKLAVGESVQGVMQGKPSILPHMKYQSNEQERDSKGNPKWTLKITLEIEGENRSLFLVNSAYWAGIMAMQDAKNAASKEGRDVVYAGALFGLKREEDGVAKPGMYAPKNYTAKFLEGKN